MSHDTGVGDLLRAIDRLERLLDTSELVELEVEAGTTTLVLRKPEALALVGAVPDASSGPAGPAAGLAASGGADATPGAGEDSSGYHAVVAPLTGVFYGSPSPGAAPYLRVGGSVSQGQVIGLIEAMKLFNEIKSDASGTVRRIAAESGSLVKAKQPLIEVELS
jgi:acetyl-CoA carboxylase biotin carboxyl carrier protein